MTPAYLRRTVYGKVSRYKLDTYLQTFDFPTPNISAEKRFTTTVPLQRLFLMNSDFMQLESEELAKRVAGEPDNQARIKKAYQLIYGRQPTEAEIKLGIDYLHSEPMKEYEENKNKPPEPGAAGGRRGRGGQGGGPGGGGGKGGGGGGARVAVTKVEAPAGDAAPEATAGAANEGGAAEVADDNAGIGNGMMGGVGGFAGGGGGFGGGGGGGGGGRRGAAPAAPTVKYDATPWGRYVKVLLSSSEFLFVN